MKDWNKLKQKWMQDPEFKKGYEALEPEYRLARSIIEARIEQKLTQSELAARAGVGQAVIARLESGTQNPRLTTISRVANALGKELSLTEASRH